MGCATHRSTTVGKKQQQQMKIASSILNKMELVFLYGTLKRGHYNYQQYLSKALECQQATFVGDATTRDNDFCLIIQTERNVPFLYFPPETDVLFTGKQIHGEVYQVSKSCLEGLDLLEDIASGFYERRQINVNLLRDKNNSCCENQSATTTEECCSCWVYGRQLDATISTSKSENLFEEFKLLNNFDNVHNRAYIPRETTPQSKILQCMMGSSSIVNGTS